MKNYKILLIALVCLLGLYGCDGFVDVATPSSQLTGTTVFEDKNTANSAMISIYSKLRDSGLLTGSSLGSGALLDSMPMNLRIMALMTITSRLSITTLCFLQLGRIAIVERELSSDLLRERGNSRM